MSLRQVADRAACLLVDPLSDELLEAITARAQHADSRIASAGDLAGDGEQVVQNAVELELGAERRPGIDQAPQSRLVERI
jgi:hypothetical protein